MPARATAKIRSALLLLGVVVVVGTTAGCVGVGGPKPGAPPHHRERGFANIDPDFALPGFWTVQKFRLNRIWRLVTAPAVAATFPRTANDGAALRANHGAPTITWVGHATLLIQLDGVNVLTDPIWSERASPFSFIGPRRLNAPGLRFEELPPIHAVVISHSHYDHLDVATVRRLGETHQPVFLVPLGLQSWFVELGISAVRELDWWDRQTVGGVTFTAVPVQHWSARTPWDTNRRLWSGWAIAGRERRAFFAGDTGYFSGFREIGERLGPFDLAAVSIGAYAPAVMMQRTHTTPEQALQIAADVRGRRLVAMHWGTFHLGDEPIDEPPRRLEAEAKRLKLDADRVWILQHGETRRW
jgi:N-acyl-phosphatidylethanolamine-hydrolysing phospholipase D